MGSPAQDMLFVPVQNSLLAFANHLHLRSTVTFTDVTHAQAALIRTHPRLSKQC